METTADDSAPAAADDQADGAGRHDDRALRDALAGSAGALARTVAWRDFPDGLVVIAAELSNGLLGVSWGTGYALAASHGEVMGRPGVLVNVADCLLLGGPAVVDVTALHEVAHMLFQQSDVDEDQAATATQLDIAATTSALAAARSHHPGWAAALAIYSRRAARIRPQFAAAIGEVVDDHLRKYGYPGADAVLEVLGHVDDDTPLRPVIGWDGERTVGLWRSLPDDESRAQAIAAGGEYRQRID